MRVDGFSVFFHVLVIAISTVVILSSYEYMAVQRIRAGEYYGLILFGTVGMCLMSSAVELVLIFIALEISSISTYILAGFRRRDAASSESSLKYFLLGSFATAFFLYGVALMFGATGSTNITAIRDSLAAGRNALLPYVAVALMFIGIGFKVAAAPFHVWTPDVYEGAPAPIVGLMSTGPKAAAFAVLHPSFNRNESSRMVLAGVAIGCTLDDDREPGRSLAGQRQASARLFFHRTRWLSARGLCRQPRTGTSPAMFYSAAYAAMNVGAFAIVSHFANADEKYVTLEDYAGLARKSPVLAATFTFFLMSLIGIPITGGFFAKFYVLNAVLKSGLVGLAIILVLNSALGAYYYLRIIVMMYMREPRGEVPVRRVTLSSGLAIAVCVLATLYLGVFPGRVLNFTTDSAAQLVHGTAISISAVRK